jgi:predicted CXXCH cytochrome family protein
LIHTGITWCSVPNGTGLAECAHISPAIPEVTCAAFKPASRVDHTQVTGTCASCHNGTIATGKNLTHIATSTLCANCHSTTGWRPATSVDHTQVTGTCFSCHNGTTATGKSATQVASSNSCDTSHKSTTSWTPFGPSRAW